MTSVSHLQPPPGSFESKFWLSNEEIKDLGISNKHLESFRERRFFDAFDLPTWYSALKNQTFKSSILELSFQQATAINNMFICEQYRLSKLSPPCHELSFSEEQNKIAQAWLLANPKPKQLLIDQIQKTLKSYPQGVFIKLGSRSPKDVPFCRYSAHFNTKLQQQILDVISKYPQFVPLKTAIATSSETPVNKTLSNPPPLPPTGKQAKKKVSMSHLDESRLLLQLNKRFAAACKCSTVEDIVSLMVHSQRIYEDISSIIQYGEKGFSASLVLREWSDKVIEHLEYEFRGFVTNGHLNALTQYYTLGMFPDIEKSKLKLGKVIAHSFYSETVKAIPHTNFIIDFLVIDFKKVYVIELNPIYSGAGTGTFSWKTEDDLLKKGLPTSDPRTLANQFPDEPNSKQLDFEFRFITKPKKTYPLALLPKAWQSLVRDHFDIRNVEITL